MKPTIVAIQEDKKSIDFQNFIESKLQLFNAKQTGLKDYKQIGFELKLSNEIKGGIIGYVYGNLLTIETFWVDEDIRNFGFGALLLEAIENESILFNCTQSSLETYSFQSIDFYLKREYKILATILLVVHKKFFLLKQLKDLKNVAKSIVVSGARS